MATLQSVVPNSGGRGDSLFVDLEGDQFTNVRRVSFGAGINVLGIRVVGDGLINCFIQIEQNAEPGPRDVTVFDPVNGDDTLAAGFQVV